MQHGKEKCGRAKSEKKSMKTNKLNYNYVTIIHRWTAVVQDAAFFKYAVDYIGGWGEWKTILGSASFRAKIGQNAVHQIEIV